MRRLFLALLLFSSIGQADVVKPALVEISIFPDYQVEVRIDFNLEAAMTGISTQYKNTQNAPNAAEYDQLRVLEPLALREKFTAFEADFSNDLGLTINGVRQAMTLKTVDIDIKGYTKRARKTILTYTTKVPQPIQTLSWQFQPSYGDSALRYQLFEKGSYNWSPWQWLKAGFSSGEIRINQPSQNRLFKQVLTFIDIGFDHVIPLGWDHILFIVGMAFSSLLWRKLLWLVSAFTLAHTLTLGLSMLGWVSIPAAIVEPLIAFSISYVAIENLLPNPAFKRKILWVFIFGLMHGLGFADMLKSFETNTEYFFATLVGFNIGVELAQIVLVVGVLLCLLLLKKMQFNYRKIVIIPGSVIIALIGFWWGLERLLI